jgi:hypothetical protein
MKAALVLLLLAGPAAAQPAPAPSTAPVEAASKPLSVAQQIARAYLPEQLLAESNADEFDRGFDASVAKDPGTAELERQYPGALAAMKSAAKEFALARFRSELPGTWDAVAAFIATNFTPAQQRELLTFYSSPAGQRILVATSKAVDSSKIVEQKKDGTIAIKSDMGSISAATDYGLYKSMSKEDMAAAMRFIASPTGRVFQAKTPALTQLIASRMNAMIAEVGPEVAVRSGEALRSYIAAHDRKQGKP